MKFCTFGKDELMEIAYKRTIILDKHIGNRTSKENMFILLSGYHLDKLKEIGL